MKTQNRIRAAGLLLLSLVFQFSFAAIGGSIMGQVTDPNTKEPVDGARVILENQGTQKEYYTNEHGFYYASNIPAGVYNISVSYMSNSAKVVNVPVSNDAEVKVNVEFSKAVTLGDIQIVEYKIPLINDVDVQNGTLDRGTIKHMPIQKVSDIGGTQSGTVQGNDGEYYVRGARAGGLSYYIDGCLVMGSPDIPLCGLDTYRMYNGFIPPKYGDATGGVVVMETRNYFSEH